MSITSRLKSTKRPTVNARHEVKKTLAAKLAKVTDSGTGEVAAKALPLNAEPGHRDLGLIRKESRHGQYLGLRGEIREKSLGGAFGGVNKTERKRRQDARAATLAAA